MSESAIPHFGKPAKVLNNVALYFSEGMALIVMDRGENRLNPEFLDTMLELLDDVERNESVKGLITTGKGKFYSNGLDLQKLAQLDSAALEKFTLGFNILMKRLVFYPIPTVAAINGHSFAGGALLAFCHDLRTMRNDKGWLCLNEVFINRVFRKSHYPLFRAKLGTGKNLTDALVLGKRHTAKEAFDRGLVHGMPSEPVLISESVRLLRSFSGKQGYIRDSLRDMKLDVYDEYLKAVDEEIGQTGNGGEYGEEFRSKIVKSNL